MTTQQDTSVRRGSYADHAQEFPEQHSETAQAAHDSPIAVGDRVTTAHRSGAGQPSITGRVVAIDRDVAVIRLRNGQTRQRSTRNCKRVAKGEAR